MITDHAYENNSNNPRLTGCTYHGCNKREDYHVAKAERNKGYEQTFLGDAFHVAQNDEGLTFNPGSFEDFYSTVFRRMDVGAEMYGDTAFFHKDNLAEALEEPPDIASYSAFELQKQAVLKLLDDEQLGEMRQWLVMATAYAALSDNCLREARRVRDRS